LTPRN